MAPATIEAAQLLFTLPAPLDPSAASTWSGHSHSNVQLKKRKRSELVLGIDCAAINVYSIKYSRLLTSYPIPPQAFLTSSPCSIFYKSARKSPSRRFTYAALRNTLSANEYQLVCISEDGSQTSSSASQRAPSPVQTYQGVGSSEDPIICIDTQTRLVQGEDGKKRNAHQVIAVQESGQVSCFSEDLKEKYWSEKLVLADMESAENTHRTRQPRLKHAWLCHAVSLAKAFANSPKDIVGGLLAFTPSDGHVSGQLNVICSVTQRGHLNIHMVKPHALKTEEQLLLSSLRRIDAWPLPISLDDVNREDIMLNANQGTLGVISKGAYTLLDLTQLRPEIVCQIPESACISGAVQQGHYMLFSKRNDCVLYDTKYHLVHSVCHVDALEKASKPGRKRKTRDSEPLSVGDRFRILEYFPMLNSIVGISARSILKLQVTMNENNDNSAKQHLTGVRLVDVIGLDSTQWWLGDTENKTEQQSSTDAKDPELREFHARMDELASRKDTAGFEEEFLASVQVVYESPLSFQDRALYTLSKMIDYNESAFRSKQIPEQPESPWSGPLKIVWMPGRVFAWLTQAGFMNIDFIKRSLKLSSPRDGQHIQRTVDSTDLIAALVQYDPSLLSLSYFLNCHAQMPLEGLVYAVSVLLESFSSKDYHANDRSSGLVSTMEVNHNSTQSGLGSSRTSGSSSALVSQLEPSEQDLEKAEAAALSDLEFATALLDSGVRSRALALRHSLARLATAFPPNDVVVRLRQIMSPSKVLLLTELLRSEITDGGWTSLILDPQYGDLETAELEQLDEQDDAVGAITSLLISCVDALGTVGWLAGGVEGAAVAIDDENTTSDDDDDNPETWSDGVHADTHFPALRLGTLEKSDPRTALSRLRHETTAALETAQESTFLVGFLHDFLQYEKTLTSDSADDALVISNNVLGDNEASQPSTKPSKRLRAHGRADPNNSMLPIGLRSVEPVSRTRVTGGGEIKARSQRDIAHRMVRKVQDYTFERLVV